jgi:hypothetical protein
MSECEITSESVHNGTDVCLLHAYHCTGSFLA